MKDVSIAIDTDVCSRDRPGKGKGQGKRSSTDEYPLVDPPRNDRETSDSNRGRRRSRSRRDTRFDTRHVARYDNRAENRHDT